MQKEDFIIS